MKSSARRPDEYPTERLTNTLATDQIWSPEQADESISNSPDDETDEDDEEFEDDDSEDKDEELDEDEADDDESGEEEGLTRKSP